MSFVGLLVGAIAGLFARLPHQPIAMAMSVAAGLLLAAVSLRVAVDAIRGAGPMAAALSLVLGAAVFSASNALGDRRRPPQAMRRVHATADRARQPGSGVAVALGNALDAAPEAMVLGIALQGPVVPLTLLIAFSVGNVPVALDRAPQACGRLAAATPTSFSACWSAVALGGALAIAAGYVGVASLSEAWRPRLQAFGAGALLAMTAETMIPEAFHNSPRFSGLFAAFGFALLLLVEATTR